MIQIEKQKLAVSAWPLFCLSKWLLGLGLTLVLYCKTDGWEQILGGDASPGKRWRLVFTTGQAVL